MTFLSRGLGLEDFVLGISSRIFYSINNLEFKLSAQKSLAKWPHAEFNRGLLSPFLLYTNESCTNSLLPQNHHDFIPCDPESLFTQPIYTFSAYPSFFIVPPWQNIMLIHIIKVFDVKRGLCLAYGKSKRYRQQKA